MARSAGITSSYNVHPIAANGTIPYQHEVGLSYSPDAVLPWAETFDLNLASGSKLTTLKQLLPNVQGPFDALQYQFWTKFSRSQQGDAGSWTAPINIRDDGYVDARSTGRALRMRISVPGPNVQPFTLGQHLIDFALRGDR